MMKMKGSVMYEALITVTGDDFRPNTFVKYGYGIKLGEDRFLDLIDAELYVIAKTADEVLDVGEYALGLEPLQNVNKNKSYSYAELVTKANDAKIMLESIRTENSKKALAEEIRRILNR